MVFRYLFLFLFLLMVAGCGTQVTVNHENVTFPDQQEILFPDTNNFDSFGRLRVSEVTSLLEIKQLNDKQDILIDEIIFSNNSSAVSQYNADDSSTTLIINNTGDYVIRQTKQITNYQAGKSHQILLTFYDFAPQPNIIKRLGYYSSGTNAPYNTNYDGLYLESSNNQVSVNIAKDGVITSITQNDWNVDKLDGTGKSNITIDWNSNHILAIDFQWLGVGRIRWSVIIDGVTIPFHYQDYTNNGYKGVYMLYPNHPLRFEIRQTGEGSGNYTHVCGSVGTEGSINQLGLVKSYDTGSTALSATISGTSYALLGIRYNTNITNNQIEIKKINILAVGNPNLYWQLRLNPIVAGNFSYNPCSFCYVDFARGDTTNTVTNGTILLSGYLQNKEDTTELVDTILKMGRYINGTSDELVLSVTPLQNNLNVYGAIEVFESR